MKLTTEQFIVSLSCVKKAFYECLLNEYKSKGIISGPRIRIAEIANVEERAAFDYLKELISAGLIEKCRSRDQRIVDYRIIDTRASS